MANDEVTAGQVAAWMLEQVQGRPLYQDEAVWTIEKQFGSQFTYNNNNGNLAIDEGVLEEFRTLSGDDIVWERGEKLWRMRTAHDAKGRQQD